MAKGPSSAPDPLPASAPKARAAGLYTIIAIKSGKALLLGMLSAGCISLMGDDLKQQFDDLLRWVNLNPEREFWAALGTQLEHLTPDNLAWLASGTLLYSLLLFAESFGLCRRSFWAVWLAIGETAFFIPIEVFDLVRHPTNLITTILVINTLMVFYLVRNRDRLFHHHRHR